MSSGKAPLMGCTGQGDNCPLMAVGIWLAFVAEVKGQAGAQSELDNMVRDGWLSVAECHGLPRVILTLRAWRRVATVSGISLN